MYNKAQLVQQSTICTTKHNLYKQVAMIYEMDTHFNYALEQSTTCTTKHNLYNKAQLVQQMLYIKRNILRHYINLTVGDPRPELKYFFLESITK